MRASCSMGSLKKPDSGFSQAALARILFQRLGVASGASLKLAYSGGLDSHVLLHALAGLRATHDLVLSAIHIDHGLFPQSHTWAHHCTQVCAQWQVPIVVESVQVELQTGEGMEAAARRARYGALAPHIRKDEVLLTAQHQDDQAETMLLQCLRGAGAQGLAGMAWQSRFSAGRLVRPLLGLRRRELLAYAQAQGLTWIEDPSNADLRYRRNILRHQVFPLLERQWPQASAMLARSAHHMADCLTLLDECALVDLASCREQKEGTVLSISRLLHLSPARQRNVLRYWLRSLGFLAPSTLHVEEIVNTLARPTRSGHARYTWPGTEIRRYRDQLHAMTPLAAPTSDLDMHWDLAQPLSIPALGGRLEAIPVMGQGISQTRLVATGVQIRRRQGGEVCRLPGRRHHHKLKKLLQDHGVTPWQRERLPLVYAGDDLVAVPGLWVCAPYAAAPEEAGWLLQWRTGEPM